MMNCYWTFFGDRGNWGIQLVSDEQEATREHLGLPQLRIGKCPSVDHRSLILSRGCDQHATSSGLWPQRHQQVHAPAPLQGLSQHTDTPYPSAHLPPSSAFMT